MRAVSYDDIGGIVVFAADHKLIQNEKGKPANNYYEAAGLINRLLCASNLSGV